MFCPVCDYSAVKVDNEYISFDSGFGNSPDYDVQGLELLYKAEKVHFWFKNRVKVILDMLAKYIPNDMQIIEVGAGTGGVARELIKEGYCVAVGELYSKGLEFARSYGITRRYQFNIYNTPFKEHFDVCCLFDVLEHLDYDYVALKNVSTMLKKNGYIILTVPAHMWLWNKDDVTAKHKRRYEQKELVHLVENAGFDVLEAKNFFLSILPLLYMRTILKRDVGGENHDAEYGSIEIHPIINHILDVVTRIENALFTNLHPSVGGSIILIGRKKNDNTI